MIGFAADSDKNRIIDLWTSAFGDSRENVEQFLKYFPCQKALGYYLDGELVSFMFLPELSICFKNEVYRANYIYALCTDERYRSRGLGSNLIEYSKEYSGKNGIDYTLVRPATESLFSYYSDKGFEREYRRIKKNLTIDGSLLYNSLDKDSSDVASVKWGNDGLDYASANGIDDKKYIPCVDSSEGERYLMLRRNSDDAELFDNVYMGLTFE